MRIVGGSHRGRKLTPPDNDRVRPTSDRVRESLFNVLAHNSFSDLDLEGARVLDLFAGTGALGLEALSRGAKFCLFVDDHTASRGLIRSNAEILGVTGQIKLFRRDATKLGTREGGAGPSFDLVFADPPYGKGLGEKALAAALAGGWLAPKALIVLEEDSETDVEIPPGFTLLDQRRYGGTQVLFLTPA